MISGVGSTLAVSAGTLLVLMVMAWVASLRLNDLSVVVVARGVGVCVIAFLCFALGDGDARRLALATGLGFLLGLVLAFGPREPPPEGVDPVAALWRVFGAAWLAVLIASLPIHGAAGSHEELGPLDYAGAAAVLAGLALGLRSHRLGIPLAWIGLYVIALAGGAWWAFPVTALLWPPVRRDDRAR